MNEQQMLVAQVRQWQAEGRWVDCGRWVRGNWASIEYHPAPEAIAAKCALFRSLRGWREEEVKLKENVRQALGEGGPTPESLAVMARLDQLLDHLTEADLHDFHFMSLPRRRSTSFWTT